MRKSNRHLVESIDICRRSSQGGIIAVGLNDLTQNSEFKTQNCFYRARGFLAENRFAKK
jgi:hypothetical protein